MTTEMSAQPIEKTSIISSLGHRLAAAIHHPTQATDRLAIVCSGYVDSKDYAHLVALATELAQKGYTVVRFDPTGTWDSEGSLAEYSTTQYLRDIRAVKEHMQKQGSFKFILIGGHSMGARMSLLYAQIDEEISAVLAIMCSYKKSLRANDKNFWEATGVQINKRDLPDNKQLTRQFAVPFTFMQGEETYNVLNGIHELHIPILLLAGEKDTLCPPAGMKEIFEKANEPKQFITIEGIGHDYRHHPSEIKLVNTIAMQLVEKYTQ